MPKGQSRSWSSTTDRPTDQSTLHAGSDPMSSSRIRSTPDTGSPPCRASRVRPGPGRCSSIPTSSSGATSSRPSRPLRSLHPPTSPPSPRTSVSPLTTRSSTFAASRSTTGMPTEARQHVGDARAPREVFGGSSGACLLRLDAVRRVGSIEPVLPTGGRRPRLAAAPRRLRASQPAAVPGTKAPLGRCRPPLKAFLVARSRRILFRLNGRHASRPHASHRRRVGPRRARRSRARGRALEGPRGRAGADLYGLRASCAVAGRPGRSLRRRAGSRSRRRCDASGQSGAR